MAAAAAGSALLAWTKAAVDAMTPASTRLRAMSAPLSPAVTVTVASPDPGPG